MINELTNYLCSPTCNYTGGYIVTSEEQDEWQKRKKAKKAKKIKSSKVLLVYFQF